jgi:hypothetical protein
MTVNDSISPSERGDHHQALDSHHLSSFVAEQMIRNHHERQHGIGADTHQPGIVRFLSDPNNRQAVDYSRIAKESGSGPILIGDSHGSVATKKDFVESLPELKSAGVQEVDFELLPGDKAMQTQLDNYARLLKNTSSSPESISAEHNKLVKHFLNIWGDGHDMKAELRTAEQLAGMVESTIKAGLRPVGIEPPVERFHRKNEGVDFFHHGLERLTADDQDAFNNFWNGSSQISQSKEHMLSALQRSGWSAEETEKFGRILDQMKAGNPPLNLSGLKLPMHERGHKDHDNKRFEDTLLAWRNDNWVPIIEAQVHSGKKVAVFAGGGHFGNAEEHETVSGLLEKRGIDSITVMKTGGDVEKVMKARKPEDKAHGFEFEPMPPELHSSAATQAKVSDKRFAYRLDHHRRQADYVIHLPNE